MLVFMPFEHAAKLLNEIYHCEISETFLKELANRIGTKLYKDAEEKGRMPYNLCNDSRSIKTMYLYADGAMAPILGEGTIEYRENKLGLVYTDRDIVHKKTKSGEKRIDIKNKRFVSSIGQGVEPFKKMFYACAVENGYRKAKNAVFLSDGAIWLKNMKDEYFPDAIHILDWYHAVDHLWGAAKKLFGEDNHDACIEWISPKKELLWNGKIDTVIQQLTREGMKSKNKQAVYFELRGYYVSNKESMRYDQYRKEGHFIGSGAIESANKYILADRLKRTGMRWTLQHANAVIWLRCKYFETQWDQFWDYMDLPSFMNHNYIVHEKGA